MTSLLWGANGNQKWMLLVKLNPRILLIIIQSLVWIADISSVWDSNAVVSSLSWCENNWLIRNTLQVIFLGLLFTVEGLHEVNTYCKRKQDDSSCSLKLYILFSCFPFGHQSTIEVVAIVKRFPFSSALQRMSVVTVAHGGRSALAFLKGSPEMVASLCRPDTGSASPSTHISFCPFF